LLQFKQALAMRNRVERRFLRLPAGAGVMICSLRFDAP
jgi:hypothetical protein